jgi:peroxiredoxin
MARHSTGKDAMVKSICMLACSLTLGQLVERGDWQLSPQLPRGQELVYSGTYLDETLAPNVKYQKIYRLETRLFALESKKQHTEVAIMTALSEQDGRPTPAGTPAAFGPASVRCELVRFDNQGRLRTLDNKAVSIPIQGPATLESGFLAEVPLTPVRKNEMWDVHEEGRPARTWQVAGTEACAGVTCIKLMASQQSNDWDHPRADQTAWRRKDVVWLAPQLNVALKVERTIERRDPAHKLPTHRATVRYELDSKLRYLGKMFDDQQREIMTLRKCQEEAAPLLKQPGLYRTQIETLLRRLTYQLDHQPETPYRKAALHFKQTLEAARRGELPVQISHEEPAAPVRRVGVGERMPDFAITSLTERQPVHLQKLLGQPTLIVFYNPATAMGRDVLLCAKDLCAKHAGKVHVLAMTLTGDSEAALKQHHELRLPFPVLDGNALRLTLAVEHTPRFVLLDADGVIRWDSTGWGVHVPGEIVQELNHCNKP